MTPIWKLAIAAMIVPFAAGCTSPYLTGATPQIGPKGWIVGGTHEGYYAGDTDAEVKFTGAASGTLRSVRPVPERGAFGSMAQSADAGRFRGQRVRFSAMVRTRGVEDWAGLWLRIDAGPGEVLAIDNMTDRRIEGDTEWHREEVVLDVPTAASDLAYGMLLSGEGQAWLDEVHLEVVGPDVPSTLDPEWTSQHLEPFNTAFELMGTK